MGQRVLTYCDPHAETAEHGGESYAFSLRKWDGSKWVDLVPAGRSVLDMCGESFGDLLAEAVEVWRLRGRPDTTDSTATAEEVLPHVCPVEGCGRPYKHRASLRQHMRNTHGWRPTLGLSTDGKLDQVEAPEKISRVVDGESPARVDGRKQPRACDQPGCDHVSQNPQGWGAHRRAVHGITGESHSAQQAARAKASAG